MENTIKTAILGGGCFWCTEAIFEDLKGVISVIPGYAGGDMNNPTYKDICNCGTGHAEVIKIAFDPCQITYKTLLEVFFATHDPTTPHQQGNDVGEQYRSMIFFTDDSQRKDAQDFMNKINGSGKFHKPIVTQIQPIEKFYTAEEYHHKYFDKNPGQPYCSSVIAPKIKKFREKYSYLLR